MARVSGEPPIETPFATEGGEPAEMQRQVYVGPTMPGGDLRQFMVFKGGLPAHLKDLFEKTPVLGRLLVSPDQLGNVRRRLSDPTSEESVWFSEAVTAMETKRGG